MNFTAALWKSTASAEQHAWAPAIATQKSGIISRWVITSSTGILILFCCKSWGKKFAIFYNISRICVTNRIKTHTEVDDSSNILCNQKYYETIFKVIYYLFPHLKKLLYQFFYFILSKASYFASRHLFPLLPLLQFRQLRVSSVGGKEKIWAARSQAQWQEMACSWKTDDSRMEHITRIF